MVVLIWGSLYFLSWGNVCTGSCHLVIIVITDHVLVWVMTQSSAKWVLFIIQKHRGLGWRCGSSGRVAEFKQRYHQNKETKPTKQKNLTETRSRLHRTQAQEVSFRTCIFQILLSSFCLYPFVKSFWTSQRRKQMQTAPLCLSILVFFLRLGLVI
jgi:hypothetical protein